MGDLTILNQIQEKVKALSTLSAVAAQLLKLVGDENHSLRDVVKVIETDAALTTKVLRVANSAAYGRGRQITSVQRAIAHLGEIMVVSIAVGSCTEKMFNTPLEGYNAEAGELWDHSLRTAIAARKVARFTLKPINPDVAFTGGLLHDIGKSILSEFLAEKADKVLELYGKGEAFDYLDAERDMIGTDHAQVGFALAQQWSLPEMLTDCIRHHHQPSASQEANRFVVYTVHIADFISMMGGTGTGSDSFAYTLDADLPKYISMHKKDFERVMLEVHEEFVIAKSSAIVGGE